MKIDALRARTEEVSFASVGSFHVSLLSHFTFYTTHSNIGLSIHINLIDDRMPLTSSIQLQFYRRASPYLLRQLRQGVASRLSQTDGAQCLFQALLYGVQKGRKRGSD